MRYSIKCEKCGRPGDIEKQVSAEKGERVHTVYKAHCRCGGKIKPIWD